MPSSEVHFDASVVQMLLL